MLALIENLEKLGWLANLLAIVSIVPLIWTAVNTYILRSEQRKRNKKVRVKLVVASQATKSYELPSPIRGGDFSRIEVMGRLGMIPIQEKAAERNKGKFDLKHVSRPEFMKEIERIRDLKVDATLIIPCTEEEFHQFELGTQKP